MLFNEFNTTVIVLFSTNSLNTTQKKALMKLRLKYNIPIIFINTRRTSKLNQFFQYLSYAIANALNIIWNIKFHTSQFLFCYFYRL